MRALILLFVIVFFVVLFIFLTVHSVRGMIDDYNNHYSRLDSYSRILQ